MMGVMDVLQRHLPRRLAAGASVSSISDAFFLPLVGLLPCGQGRVNRAVDLLAGQSFPAYADEA